MYNPEEIPLPANRKQASGLTARYNSLNDIVDDPLGRALAFAQDKKYSDWLNFQMKSFIIRERVMNQVVHVNIDGVMTPLTNPDTNLPLIYSDFITDRSGPKFGGYLNDAPGTEYLEGNADSQIVSELIKLQKEKTIQYCQKNNLPIPDEESLNAAVSVFERKHKTQRKLSDFDLTARETNLLERAVKAEVEKKLTPEQGLELNKNPKLASTIGKTAWQYGGIIDTKLVSEYLEAIVPSPITYEKAVRNRMVYPTDPDFNQFIEPPRYQFTHMLIEGVGKTVRQEYLKFYEHINEPVPAINLYRNDSSGVPDLIYGLGIPFMEASIESLDDNGKLKLTTDHSQVEIGDIICDNSSIFGRIFSPKNNFDAACTSLQLKGITEEKIKSAMIAVADEGMGQSQVFEHTLRYLVNDPTLDASQKEASQQVFNQYKQQEQFIESGLIAEESAKKEGQSQSFRRKNSSEKLIGNISDTAPFVEGIMKTASNSNSHNQSDAKAHLQIIMLTTLISVTRWGVNASNHEHVKDTHAHITPEAFMDSINKRSYEGDESTEIRKKLKLNDISIEEAKIRLDAYKKGFEPIWETIQKNEFFYQLVEHYKEAKKALSNDPSNINLQNDLSDSHFALKNELNKIITEQMPDLAEKLDQFTPGEKQKKEALNSIMEQLVEAIDFGYDRELKEAHVLPPASPNTSTISIDYKSRMQAAKTACTKNIEQVVTLSNTR